MLRNALIAALTAALIYYLQFAMLAENVINCLFGGFLASIGKVSCITILLESINAQRGFTRKSITSTFQILWLK